jgi:hypothetical protein
MKQTAVEWLYDQLTSTWFDKASGTDILKKAKEMEKEQRIMDYNAGHSDGLCNHINDADNYINEQYYNETYGDDT